MNRRKFLRHLGSIPALPGIASLLAARAAGASPMRRVRPGDKAWPNAASWDKLKQQVGGRLIPVPSPLAPCKDAPASAACAARIEELRNPYFISEQPGGTQTSGWLDAWTSAPSAYAVAAENTEDVVAAVNFARENNLRLVVKGGGHSYQGTSNSADSLLIWTRHMHAIMVRDEFVAAGCAGAAPRPAVTVEAGARWLQTYEAVTTGAGRYVQGGGCATVGVAGLVQSGGFGSFSKNYGTAAASLLEAEIVTADGRVRVVSSCKEPDLFWALKGGGGGSLGVVTRVTLATHALPENFGAAEGRVQAKSEAAFRRLIVEFVRFYGRALFNPHWGEQATFGKDNSLTLNMVMQGLSLVDAQAVWLPFRDFVAGSPDDFQWTRPLEVSTFPARHWWDAAYRKAHDASSVLTDSTPGAPAGNVYWTGNEIEVNVFLYGFESLWLPATLLEEPGRLADALFAATPPGRRRPAFQQGSRRRAPGTRGGRPRHGHEPRGARCVRTRDHGDGSHAQRARSARPRARSRKGPRAGRRRDGRRRRPARGRSERRRLRVRVQLLRQDLAEVVLGPELLEARRREEEVRPGGPLLRPQRRGQRRVERRRLHAGGALAHFFAAASMSWIARSATHPADGLSSVDRIAGSAGTATLPREPEE